MSQRRRSSAETRAPDLMASILERLDKLERGEKFKGPMSFVSPLRIGNVTITIVDAGGGHANVVLKNLTNGLTSTIDL